MPPTAIFLYPPSATYSSLSARFSNAFPSIRPAAQPPWVLAQQLWRGTSDPAKAPPTSPAEQAHLQVIRVSPHASRFVHTTPAASTSAKPSTVKLPGNSTLMSLLTTKLALLWSPVRQYNLEVHDGLAWHVGVMEIRVGEVHGPLPGTSGVVQKGHRGTVLVVRLVEEGGWDAGEDKTIAQAERLNQTMQNGGNSGEQSTDDEQLQIQEMMKMINRTSGPALELVQDFWGSFDDWKSEVALWSEVLRHPALSGAVRR